MLMKQYISEVKKSNKQKDSCEHHENPPEDKKLRLD